MWTYGFQNYTKELVARVRQIYGYLPRKLTLMPVADYHPELDDNTLLGIDNHRKFQILLGML